MVIVTMGTLLVQITGLDSAKILKKKRNDWYSVVKKIGGGGYTNVHLKMHCHRHQIGAFLVRCVSYLKYLRFSCALCEGPFHT